jgi:YtkA-like
MPPQEEEVITVRVRPFFWCLLIFSCIGVLVFAANVHPRAPAIMQMQLEQQPPVTEALTILSLRLTDQNGVPIEQAQVAPSASMTNMDMTTNQVSVRSLGQGNYLAQLHLYMAGPWEIRVGVYADGFDPLQRTLFVQVQ